MKKFGRSVVFALHGLREVFVHEHSFRIHALGLIALVAIILGFRIRSSDAALLILVATAVLVLELVNSIFERFLDTISPRVGTAVRDMKDIMAGAVLIASVAALITGIIIILPYLPF